MAMGYRPVVRDQVMLLPPDLRDWLPPEHLAWFVLRVVEQVDTAPFHARAQLGGVGRRGFDPDMMLGLLLYAYAVGVRSSRQVQRLCETDVAFRVLCAQDAPDHSTLARFRQVHEGAFTHLFSEVLVVCAQAGLGRLGVVAVDGTKVAADAARGASVGEHRARELASRVVAEAARADADEDALFGAARGDEVPAELTGPRASSRIRELLAEREVERAAAAASERDRQEREVAERELRAARELERVTGQDAQRVQRRVARALVTLDKAERQAQEQWRQWHERDALSRRLTGAGVPGTRPVRPDEHSLVREIRGQLQRAQAAGRTAQQLAERAARRCPGPAPVLSPTPEPPKINLTDPDSRLMRAPHGNGWVQGFNAQAAVSEDQIVLVAQVCDQPNDMHQFQPVLAELEQTVAELGNRTGQDRAGVGTVLADAGYASEANLSCPGPDRLIALGRKAPGTPTAKASARRHAMRERLISEQGAALYRKRQHTVEPVFGQIKHNHGFRRFSRRGLPAVQAEWNLVSTVHNLLKLAAHTQRAAPTVA